jgi:hypothetical protein
MTNALLLWRRILGAQELLEARFGHKPTYNSNVRLWNKENLQFSMNKLICTPKRSLPSTLDTQQPSQSCSRQGDASMEELHVLTRNEMIPLNLLIGSPQQTMESAANDLNAATSIHETQSSTHPLWFCHFTFS